MLKALGKVIESVEVEKGEASLVRLRTRIVGEAHPALKLPPGLKGRYLWVERIYRGRLKPRKGEFVVLTHEELKGLLEHGREPLVPGRAFKEDVDADGHSEVNFESDVLRFSVAPHRGATLRSLEYRGKEFFMGKGEYLNVNYIELGGVDDHIESGKYGGALSSLKYEYEVDEGEIRLTGRAKGFEIEKAINLERDFPLLTVRTSFKARKKAELNYWMRMAVRGVPGRSVILLPARDGLVRERYHFQYLDSLFRVLEISRMSLPGILVLDEAEGVSLLAVFSRLPENVAYRSYGTFFTVEPAFERAQLKKGEVSQCVLGLIPGTFYSASRFHLGVFDFLEEAMRNKLVSSLVTVESRAPELLLKGKRISYSRMGEFGETHLWKLDVDTEERDLEEASLLIGGESYGIDGL